MPKHYSVVSFKELGVDCVHEIFKGMEEDNYKWEYNWCFTGTDGVHGHSYSIERLREWLEFKKEKGITKEMCCECTRCVESPSEESDEITEKCPYKDRCCGDTLTILIVMPRIVALRYGTVEVTLEDLEKIKFYQEQTMKYLNKTFLI